MPEITLNDILEQLDCAQELRDGLTKGEKTVDDFKTYLQSTWIHRDMVESDKELIDKIYGRRLGAINTELIKNFKDFGVSKADTEGKKIEDLLKLASSKVNEKIKELNENAGKSDDKKLEDLQTKLNALTEKYQLSENAVLAANQEKEKLSNDFNSKMKEFKLNTVFNNVKSAIKWKDDITEVEKIGFDAMLKNKYRFDVDEKENPIVLDGDGNKVKNQKATAFISLQELVEKEATDQKLIKLNNAGASGARAGSTNGINFGNGQAGQDEGIKRKLHPNALKNYNAV